VAHCVLFVVKEDERKEDREVRNVMKKTGEEGEGREERMLMIMLASRSGCFGYASIVVVMYVVGSCCDSSC